MVDHSGTLDDWFGWRLQFSGNAPSEQPTERSQLGDGSQWGMRFRYAVQDEPNGLAQALLIAEPFLAGNPCCLILGDNIFYGAELPRQLQQARARTEGATLFAYHVQDPEGYGVLGFDEEGKVQTIVEKPVSSASQYAVTGIYFYDDQASKIARTLRTSHPAHLAPCAPRGGESSRSPTSIYAI